MGQVDRERKNVGIGTLPGLLISVVVSILMIGSNVYIAAVIHLILRPDQKSTIMIYLILICFPFIMILRMITTHNMNSRTSLPFNLLSGIVMALFQYLFLWAAMTGPVLLVLHLAGLYHIVFDLSSWFIFASALIILGLLVYGYISALDLKITKVKVPAPGIERDEVVIGVLSDLHVGPLVRPDRIRRIRSALERERPDILIMAGDLFDTRPSNVKMLIPYLIELWKIAPTYGVMGNHEFLNGALECDRAIRDMGITLLRGEKTTDEVTGIDIIGLDDFHDIKGEAPRRDIAGVLDGPATRPTILINHQPVNFRRAAEYGILLQISGHTHGGQMWPNHLITRLIFRDGDRGLISRYGSNMFITLGAGTWGPPIRIGNPPEIAFITLGR